MLIATVFLPIVAPSPLALYASVIAVACLLVVMQADAIRRWHRSAHPLVVRFTIATLIAVVLATATGAAATYLPYCSQYPDSWACWLAGFGLF